MTKRFSYNVNKNCIECDGKFVVYVNSVDGFRIANYWNGLYKENEQLNNENKHLREALKKEYMAITGNLCDACKHEEKDNTNNWFVGIDYDVKCNKGHEILLNDEEQKCEDFEFDSFRRLSKEE